MLEGHSRLTLLSLHDGRGHTAPWLVRARFRGFGGRRFQFVWRALVAGFSAHTVIISHVNLALPVFLLRVFRPRLRLIVLTHGVEVWEKPVSLLGRAVLRKADVVSVSTYTAGRLQALFGVESTVIHNCLSPFLAPVQGLDLRSKWGIGAGEKVVLTLSRLAATEHKKGYDHVVAAVAQLRKGGLPVRYVFAGKYETTEKERLEALARASGFSDLLLFTGFVPDDSLGDLFVMADVYIMPSRKEGFGITFIEAMHYGVPVIAGNADGSVDALLGGRLGLLVDPQDDAAILDALYKVLEDPARYRPDRALLHAHFGFDRYRRRWEAFLGAPTAALS